MLKFIIKHIVQCVFTVIAAAVLVFTILYCAPPSPGDVLIEKPVIYLYPQEELRVSVAVEGVELGTTYPAYNRGWEVAARPDGTLINLSDGLEYSYLFWDGYSDVQFDVSQGFCVAGTDTAAFLQETLAQMGLTPREYNELIVYWLPLMEGNPYNLISFQGPAYTGAARLAITPEPDSLLRVFMAWKPLDGPVEVAPQTFEPFVREGFTVVEWGGAQVK